jgi:hypothetical protein
VVAVSPGTVVTPYEQLAASVKKALLDIKATVPNLERGRRMAPGFVRTHVNFPVQSLKTVFSAVEATAALQAIGKYNLDANRDSLQFLDSFQSVIDSIGGVYKDMKRVFDTRKAALVFDSLQIYAIAQGVIRDPDEILLATHVENMKRDLRRKGGRKKKQTNPGPVLAAAA